MAKKTQTLTETTTLGDDDVFYVVRDPSGVPVDRKITAASLRAMFATSPGLTPLSSIETPDGNNQVFTFTEKPDYILNGGAWYEETQGWSWNAGLLQATMDVPPPLSTLKLLGFK